MCCVRVIFIGVALRVHICPGHNWKWGMRVVVSGSLMELVASSTLDVSWISMSEIYTLFYLWPSLNPIKLTGSFWPLVSPLLELHRGWSIIIKCVSSLNTKGNCHISLIWSQLKWYYWGTELNRMKTTRNVFNITFMPFDNINLFPLNHSTFFLPYYFFK